MNKYFIVILAISGLYSGILALTKDFKEDGITPNIHTVFLTDCKQYFVWQSLGIMFSYKKSGQVGPITRIMCCTDEEFEKTPKEWLDIAPTHIAPSYTIHPKNGDHYGAYNKPLSVYNWTQSIKPKEDWVLIIDADMILRDPWSAEQENLQLGHAVAAFFPYLQGVKNELAERHIPEVLPRNDTLGGPYGRKADQVGGIQFMHVDDLTRVAPLWLKYTEDVRLDPEAWKYAGDQYAVKEGIRPWISEMYGYVYAAAKAGLWHTADHHSMLYPGYIPNVPPKTMHYGLLFNITDDYKFDKHFHYNFDPFQCPPWELGEKAQSSDGAGLFPHPPKPSEIPKNTGFLLLRDLLAIETINTLNMAFCELHIKRCPPTDELLRQCLHVQSIENEIIHQYQNGDYTYTCEDLDERCDTWAKAGECDKNIGYMSSTCRKSCQSCHQLDISTLRSKKSYYIEGLREMAAKLQQQTHKEPEIKVDGQQGDKGKVLQQPARKDEGSDAQGQQDSVDDNEYGSDSDGGGDDGTDSDGGIVVDQQHTHDDSYGEHQEQDTHSGLADVIEAVREANVNKVQAQYVVKDGKVELNEDNEEDQEDDVNAGEYDDQDAGNGQDEQDVLSMQQGAGGEGALDRYMEQFMGATIDKQVLVKACKSAKGLTSPQLDMCLELAQKGERYSLLSPVQLYAIANNQDIAQDAAVYHEHLTKPTIKQHPQLNRAFLRGRGQQVKKLAHSASSFIPARLWSRATLFWIATVLVLGFLLKRQQRKRAKSLRRD